MPEINLDDILLGITCLLAFFLLQYFGINILISKVWYDGFPSFSQVTKFVLIGTLIWIVIAMSYWYGFLAWDNDMISLHGNPPHVWSWWQFPFAILGFLLIIVSMITLVVPSVALFIFGSATLVVAWLFLIFYYPISKGTSSGWFAERNLPDRIRMY